jgi:hypothetical protein
LVHGAFEVFAEVILQKKDQGMVIDAAWGLTYLLSAGKRADNKRSAQFSKNSINIFR